MDKKLIVTPEVSWLNFNARVLQEAEDPTNSLKNRIRFLGIYSNNRDEFFRSRMAAVKQLIPFDLVTRNKSFPGKNSQKILEQIYAIVLDQQSDFDRIWKKINEQLKKDKIFLIDEKTLNSKQQKFAIDYFDQEVSPSIFPFMIENMPHWPSFGDDSTFLGIAMKKTIRSASRKYAIIEIPTKNHPRFISLPSNPGEQSMMLLEDLIRFNLPKIFFHLGYTYFKAHTFKVTKDAKIDIDDDISTTFIQKIEKGLKNRRKSNPISFLYDKAMDKELLKFLMQKLNLSPKNIIIPGGRIRNFRDFMNFPLKFSDCQPKQMPFKHPALAKTLTVSDLIMKQDVLLHFPYHSFNSIINLLCEAAMDNDVKSIKITAYRLADNSKICNALINAARAGKRVHVILELRASFDEHANLEWKKKLEEEGVKVFLSIPHMKVHAKICMITKKLGNKIVQYGFIGTGNLNETTMLYYTDLFLLTSNRPIMIDLNRIFKALENPIKNWFQLSLCKTLLVSPVNMRETLSSKIEREIKIAQSGKPSRIIINLNSISDAKLITKLYQAAEVGVKIDMIIRGVFCIETNRVEFAQPIAAISIVDEYLEHNRVWLFHNGGNEEIYISSSDWNERNLDHRIEIATPIRDKAIRSELKHILEIKLSDNIKARRLNGLLSNEYISSRGKKKIRSQLAIYHYLKKQKAQ
ncbi:MAG: polyphosphate kinase 1 [Parachlamydiaceae bacterium]|nr:polyphosphate kinase 1 [Parachlamydiaceae bacterium]